MRGMQALIEEVQTKRREGGVKMMTLMMMVCKVQPPQYKQKNSKAGRHDRQIGSLVAWRAGAR